MEPLIQRPDRRRFFGVAGLAGVTWLTPIGTMLARAAEGKREPATSVIMLWMQGGPSQLETFDPHPGKNIAGGTGSIKTSVKDLILAPGLERTAEEMGSISLIRSLTSKEGDHERGTYTMKTGFRPDPTIIHPGWRICHEMRATASVSPPLSIRRASGRLVGFMATVRRLPHGRPCWMVPDTQSFLPPSRAAFETSGCGRRGLCVVVKRAIIFTATPWPDAENDEFELQGSTFQRSLLPFERCTATPSDVLLAAQDPIEVGVRCVEVRSRGDTHANNHTQQRVFALIIMDPFCPCSGTNSEEPL